MSRVYVPNENLQRERLWLMQILVDFSEITKVERHSLEFAQWRTKLVVEEGRIDTPPLTQVDSQFTDRSVSAECLISVLHNLPEREFPYALRYLVLFSKMPREFPSPCVGC